MRQHSCNWTLQGRIGVEPQLKLHQTTSHQKPRFEPIVFNNMQKVIVRHLVIQAIFLWVAIDSRLAVTGINRLIESSGGTAKDTHLSLGVYAVGILVLLLPVTYLILGELFFKERISIYFNYWFFRVEIVLVWAIGMYFFFLR